MMVLAGLGMIIYEGICFIKKKVKAHNLWMNCEKARKYGVEFSDVSDGLKRCLNDYKMTIKQ